MKGPGRTQIDLIRVEADGEYGIVVDGVLQEDRYEDERTGEKAVHCTRARERIREEVKDSVELLVRDIVEPWVGDIGPDQPTDARWVADTLRVVLERYTAASHNNLLREEVFSVVRAHGGFEPPPTEQREGAGASGDEDVPF